MRANEARTASRWVDQWASLAEGIVTVGDWRSAHRWMWHTWRARGRAAATGINDALGLTGPDVIQPDIPHAFAGNLGGASILLVNINPGWNERLNRIEDAIVRTSEEASWEFSRRLFTTYPKRVGQMYWWNRCIGIAWRTLKGGPPDGISVCIKREWANSHIAAVELFPLHSNSAGFLRDYSRPSASTRRMQESIFRGMRATLTAALRLSIPLSVVVSKAGTRFVNDMAQSECWSPISPLPPGLPAGSTVHRVGSIVVVAIPRPLVTKRSALPPDVIASALREVMTGNAAQGRRAPRRSPCRGTRHSGRRGRR